MVHNIDEKITEKDIKSSIAGKLRLNTAEIRVRFTGRHCKSFRNTQTHCFTTILFSVIHGKESQCANVELPSSTHVDTIMKTDGPIRFGGKELSISRMLPKSYFLSHQTTTGLLIQIQNNEQLSNEKLKTILQYFEQYGQINYNEYINQQYLYVIFQQ
jgi:hypothetical protein